MPRIEPVSRSSASPEAARLLDAVKSQMGGVPNLVATMANSPATLQGFLGLSGALGGGRFDAQHREQIALAVAGANGCDYCASAHTALGRRHGLAPEELARNLAGSASDPRVAATLRFAKRIVATRGRVSADDLAELRRHGFGDEDIVELVGHTVLNIFTNYVNHVAETTIDFPLVATASASAA